MLKKTKLLFFFISNKTISPDELLSTQHFMLAVGHLMSSRTSKQINVASACTQTPGQSFEFSVDVIVSRRPNGVLRKFTGKESENVSSFISSYNTSTHSYCMINSCNLFSRSSHLLLLHNSMTQLG